MKITLITIVALVVTAALVSYIKLDMSLPRLVNVFEFGPKASEVVEEEDKSIEEPEVKLKAANFSGAIEEVNVGCFADGECYVVVDGKHITVLRGWSSDEVGTIQGALGIGDLENFIGDRVDVYAQDLSDGTYTLYGSEGFYVKLVGSQTVSVKMNETVDIFGAKLTPVDVLEDSRCPIDVQCIQAGTVRLMVNIENNLGAAELEFTLSESVVTETQEITLIQVEPTNDSKAATNKGEYTFIFKVKYI